jgi:tRNA threonylcarbamoyladenosine modification (KEOPS) complex Cgi121 subunit
LRVEKIGTENHEKTVGIAEFQNTRELTQNQLIQLVVTLSSDETTIQLLNGLLISDEIHLLSAAENAINAQHGNYMLSRSLDVEIIVFASAQRQIGKAIEALGVYDGLGEVAAVVLGRDAKSVENTIQKLAEKIGQEIIPAFPPTMERLRRIKKQFEISNTEISTISDSESIESQMAALSRCVVSRVSLVAIDS